MFNKFMDTLYGIVKWICISGIVLIICATILVGLGEVNI